MALVGSQYSTTPFYTGAATGFPNSASINTWYEITAVAFSNSGAATGNHWLVSMSWANHNTTYGYTLTAQAIIHTNSPNTGGWYRPNDHWNRTTMGDNGGSFNGIQVQTAVHTSTTSLEVKMKMTEEAGWDFYEYPPLRLAVMTNATPTSAPSIQVYRGII
jgi:hypothetical protein